MGGRRTQRTAPKSVPRRDPLPGAFSPQLALLVKTIPNDASWLHEIKFDGYRIGCRLSAGRAQLLSRNGKDWTTRFPAVCAALTALPAHQALLDGEVAVVLPDGRTSFQALQNAGTAPGDIVYFVFDLLHLDGVNVSREPLERRKHRLAALLEGVGRSSPIRYATHIVGQGNAFFEKACAMGLEGVVSKRRDQPYTPGRNPGWVKTKCVKRQEFVIGGFTDPEGSRAGIGALLVGVYDSRGGLDFCGKVGTGFTQSAARALRARLSDLEQRDSPFAERLTPALSRRTHWVRPTLVAEVAFTEWTNDGKIRHPSFQGLREDKAATAIVRERPAETPVSRQRSGESAVVAGVALSHPDRVVYSEIGITKLEIARFYESIADWILPHLAGRPLTLVRCPQGVDGSCFFMKHSGGWAPPLVRRVLIQEKTKMGEYLVVDHPAALIALVQANVIELHTWNATVDRIEVPDRLVFDLDPGPRVPWTAVLDAARVVRAALRGLELESFVKTTGGKGLHVVVPLVPVADWRAGLAFARAVAEAIVRFNPRLYTTAFAKAGREQKILIDIMRNNRLHTSIAAFSSRARPSGGVSMPVAWDELPRLTGSDLYTLRNVVQRLRRRRTDPWGAYWKTAQRIPADFTRRLAGIDPR